MKDRETLGFMVNDIARMVRAAFERRIATADLGLTTAEARTLIYIAMLGEVRQFKIAERMNVEPMTTSKVIDRLEERGLVERRQDPADRRAKLVRMTPGGEAMVGDIDTQTAAMREDMMAGLAPDQREAMISGLRAVRANLQALTCRAEQAEASE